MLTQEEATQLHAVADEVQFTDMTAPRQKAAADKLRTFIHHTGPITMSLVPSVITLRASQTQQFRGTSTGPYGAVSYGIDPPIGTITPQGLYTAPPVIEEAADVKVTVASVMAPSKVADAIVTLAPSAVEVPDEGLLAKTHAEEDAALKASHEEEAARLAKAHEEELAKLKAAAAAAKPAPETLPVPETQKEIDKSIREQRPVSEQSAPPAPFTPAPSPFPPR